VSELRKKWRARMLVCMSQQTPSSHTEGAPGGDILTPAEREELATKGRRWRAEMEAMFPAVPLTASAPGARPGLATMLREATQDGRELVDFALTIWRNEKHPMHMRWRAFDFLLGLMR
jgi:hypothetical protein